MSVIDAKGAVVGRLASHTAKLALDGKSVSIINIGDSVITGDSIKIEEKYLARRHLHNKSNPENSVKWPRRPDLLFKKIVSGMLPKHSPRQKLALSRIKVYLGHPHGLAVEPKPDPKAGHRKITAKYITLTQLCNQLGWKINE